MSTEDDSDVRLKKLYNALHESREGCPFWDFIDEHEAIECFEYLISELNGVDFISNWEYMDL
jgi:hypothetical protein